MNLLTKLINNSINAYLHGYKELSAYYKKDIRTLMRWHKLLPIPWEKSGPKKNDSVRMHILVADAYFRKIKKLQSGLRA